jgi:TolB-like protein/Flp pilus assembly protein TadD
MPDVFLSYSREDQAVARRFATGLERAGFSVWWDQALTAGEAFDRVTERALDEARAVVVLWSRHSVESNWVRAEATQAHASQRLVPVMIEPCRRPILFELTHAADLAHWRGEADDPAWVAFVAGLRRFVAGETTRAAAEPEPPPAASAARRRWRAWVGTAVVAVVALGVVGFLHWRGAGSGAAAREASVAVLPFRDMSPEHDQEYFADGVTEEILNSLAALRDLKVTARTSAFAFKGKDVDLRTIGRTLGVRHILEGSVRKDDQKLRITAQLIDAQTDAHLWSKTYDRRLADVFAVQEEIARSVAEQLQVALGVGLGREPGMTRDPAAYDAWLASVAARSQYTHASHLRSLELAQRAVELDPSFARAWEQLGVTYDELPAIAGPDAVPDSAGKADEAFRRAAALLPQSPGIQRRLYLQDLEEGRWKEAADRMQAWSETKVSWGPISGEIEWANFLMLVGRPRRAIPILERARAMDPLNPGIALFLAAAYGEAGDFADAGAESDRGDALDEAARNLIRNGAVINALAARDDAEIRRRLDAVISIQAEAGPRDFNARLKALLGKPAEAIAFLRASRAAMPPFAHAATANWHAWFGDPEGALENLRFAAEHGANGAVAVELWRPTMGEVRKLPAFRQLLRDMGMAEYLAASGWNDYCEAAGGDFECR